MRYFDKLSMIGNKTLRKTKNQSVILNEVKNLYKKEKIKAMLQHNIKHSIRNFRANKLIFTGSILTAIMCALSISLLYTYIDNEMSMDDFHKNKKDIYFFTKQRAEITRPSLTSPHLYLGFNHKSYSGIKELVSLSKYRKNDIAIKLNNKIYPVEAIATDSVFFKVFDFPILAKNKDVLLESSNSIAITKRLADRLFGKENPLGKSLEVLIDDRDKMNFFVDAVIENPPSNSSMKFDLLFPDPIGYNYSRGGKMGGDVILVSKGFDKEKFQKDIEKIGNKHRQFLGTKIGVIPFKDIYFNSLDLETLNIFTAKGDKKNLNILWGIILIIFFISVFNFANLQVVNINSSLKNIGVNKLFGANISTITTQKATELLIMILIAIFLIIPLYELALPWVNKLLGVELTPPITRIFLLNFVILLLLVVSAMIYPFIISSKVSIVNSLKKQVSSKGKLSGAKWLITAQFALAIFLLMASFVVLKQLNMMLNKDVGFTAENVVKTKLMYYNTGVDDDKKKSRKEMIEVMFERYNFIKNELTRNSAIESFSQGNSPIKSFDMNWKLKEANDADYITANILMVEPQYLKTLDIKLKEGRFFDREKDYGKRGCKKVVINEAAMKYWNITNIEDTRLQNSSWHAEGGYEIIGVVKNFNSESLKTQIRPLIMYYMEREDADFLIKFHKGKEKEGLLFLKKLYEKVNPIYIFDYSFVSEEVKSLYDREKRLSQIYVAFTFIAFFLSVISLFTIALYDTRKRTKEVGIRKVNGSTIKEVMLLLNKDFVKWVIIAFVIATPIAYYAMNKWLKSFAYKTTLSWWIFALAGVSALAVALLTVTWQSYRAASRNPVEALRYE